MGTTRALVMTGLTLFVVAVICGLSPVSAPLAQAPGPPTTVACGTALGDSDEYHSLRFGGSPSTSPLSFVFMSSAQYQTASTCRDNLLIMRVAAVAALLLSGVCTAAALMLRHRVKRSQGE